MADPSRPSATPGRTIPPRSRSTRTISARDRTPSWYQFKVEWNQTLVRWYKDNILQCSVSLLPIKKKGKILPGAPKVPLRHLYLGSDYRVLYYQPPNVTYRNVKIVVQ